MYKLQLIDSLRFTVETFSKVYESLSQAQLSALNKATIYKAIMRSKGLKARIQSTKTGYKVKYLEINIIAI